MGNPDFLYECGKSVRRNSWLTPIARAKLQALATSTEVAAQSLEKLSATGAQIRQRRAAALTVVDAQDDDEYEDSEGAKSDP